MTTTSAKCCQCGAVFQAKNSHFNRAQRGTGRMFCGRVCADLARRVSRSNKEQKQLKAEYDKKRRSEKADEIRKKKAEYYQRTKDPVKEAKQRKKRAHLHAEYCRSPKYKEWKREYDRRYLAQKRYGEFSECFLLAQDIRSECLSRQSDYEIRLSAGTLTKSQNRKRDHVRINSNKLEAGPLGGAQ